MKGCNPACENCASSLPLTLRKISGAISSFSVPPFHSESELHFAYILERVPYLSMPGL
jgi:hypothetical protein